MIVKSYELQKIDLEKNLFVLLYGTNEGSKNQATNIILGKKKITSIYEEKEILLNSNLFLEDIYSGSLFEEEKVLIIRRASDRLLEILVEIIDKNLEKITIIINCDNLEKKSKLRSLFEKRKDLICIPFYPDTDQVLAKIANNFFFQKKNFNFFIRYKI